MWVKVFVTELPEALQGDDLDRMVIDHPAAEIVPEDPAEVEIEWVLLQASTENEGEQEFGGGAEVGEGNEAVSRRFEFYKYVGEYDLETHEALCDNPETCPEAVGDMIGAQNVAINLAGPLVGPGNHAPVASPDNASTAEDTTLTIGPASLLLNDNDEDADSLTIASVQGPVGGTVDLVGGNVVFTPSADFNGAAGFYYTVDDGNGGTSTAGVEVMVSPVNDAPVANAGMTQTVARKATVSLTGGGSDIDGDTLTYLWTFDTKPAHSKAAFSNATSMTPSFEADKEGTYLVRLVVNDGTINSPPDFVTITVTKK